MPPQAKEPVAGFRYTPSSYLQRTRLENRPWTGASSSEDGKVAAEEAELMELKQEDRPLRKHSTIDANFQSRIQKRKDLYRGILKGEVEIVDPYHDDGTAAGTAAMGTMSRSGETSTTATDDVFSNSTMSLYFIRENEFDVDFGYDFEDETKSDPGNCFHSQAQAKAARARLARQRRLIKDLQPPPSSNKTCAGFGKESEAEQLKVMRAHRLRQLKRLSLEETSFGEVLRQRRQEQIEQDRLEKELQRNKEEEYWREQQRLEEERASGQLSWAEQEERRLLEASKKRAAAIEHQQRRKQERLEAQQEAERVWMDKQELLERKRLLKQQDRSNSKTRGTSTKATLPDFSFLEDLSSLVRESGLIKTCVSSCFGDEIDERHQCPTDMATLSYEVEDDVEEPPSLSPLRGRGGSTSRRSNNSSNNSRKVPVKKQVRYDLELSEESSG